MKHKRGLIKMIVIIIIALIILGVFGYNITDILQKPDVQSNLGWFWNILYTIWAYISAPIIFIWDKFVIGVVWNAVQAGLH